MAERSIEKEMDAARVPIAARATTLPRLGQVDLRHMLEEDLLDYKFTPDEAEEEKWGTRGVCISPGKQKDYGTARLVGGVMAKEMILKGHPRVALFTLDEILDQIEEDPKLAWEWNQHFSTTVILDFYLVNSQSPITGRQASKIQSMILRGIDNGFSFSVVTDVPINQAHPWWAPSFLNAFAKHNVMVEV